jgi:phospholipid/cholesterol/gamma-HCH transport system substrate-binding protein
MQSSRSHLLVVLAALAVAGSFLGLLLLSGGSAPSIGGRSYHLRLLSPTAVSIVPGCEVRIAGLGVGRVSDVELRGKGAVIDVEIDGGQGPLPADTTYDVRLRTVIGETFVELYPGKSKRMLASGAILPMSSLADEYVDVEQILDVLKGDTRDQARQMIRALGSGLRGRGPELNEFVQSGSGLLRDLAPMAKVLGHDRRQVARLVDEFGRLADSVADRGTAIQTLARQSRVTAEAVADRDQALRATLQELPSSLRQVRKTTRLLGQVTGETAPVITDVAALVRDSRPVITRLEPATTGARSVLRELGAASPVLSRTLTRAEALAGPAAAALPGVRAVLCQFLPMAQYLAPYAREMAATVQNIASATAYYDANGHAARLEALVGDNNFAGYTPEQAEALKMLTSSGVLREVHSIGYNPYPSPGDVGPPSAGVGQTGPKDYKGTYPRVTAAC